MVSQIWIGAAWVYGCVWVTIAYAIDATRVLERQNTIFPYSYPKVGASDGPLGFVVAHWATTLTGE